MLPRNAGGHYDRDVTGGSIRAKNTFSYSDGLSLSPTSRIRYGMQSRFKTGVYNPLLMQIDKLNVIFQSVKKDFNYIKPIRVTLD